MGASEPSGLERADISGPHQRCSQLHGPPPTDVHIIKNDKNNFKKKIPELHTSSHTGRDDRQADKLYTELNVYLCIYIGGHHHHFFNSCFPSRCPFFLIFLSPRPSSPSILSALRSRLPLTSYPKHVYQGIFQTMKASSL